MKCEDKLKDAKPRIYEFYDSDFSFLMEIDAEPSLVKQLLNKYRDEDEEYNDDGSS